MNVWTNGCFDIVHLGHIKLFEYAKNFGDQLIVGIDSDERIKKSKKGEKNRPINNQYNRMEFLKSIKYIDKIVIFNSDSELKRMIKMFNIGIMVIGSDYKFETVIGDDLARVVFFDRIPNFSTTEILNGR